MKHYFLALLILIAVVTIGFFAMMFALTFKYGAPILIGLGFIFIVFGLIRDERNSK